MTSAETASGKTENLRPTVWQTEKSAFSPDGRLWAQ